MFVQRLTAICSLRALIFGSPSLSDCCGSWTIWPTSSGGDTRRITRCWHWHGRLSYTNESRYARAAIRVIKECLLEHHDRMILAWDKRACTGWNRLLDHLRVIIIFYNPRIANQLGVHSTSLGGHLQYGARRDERDPIKTQLSWATAVYTAGSPNSRLQIISICLCKIIGTPYHPLPYKCISSFSLCINDRF